MAFVNIETINKGHWMQETPNKPNFRLYAWNMVNMNVNYSQGVAIIKGRTLVCNAGESLFCYETWDTLIGLLWGSTKTRRFFKDLEKRGYVRLKSEGVTIRVTVCNWGDLKNKKKLTKAPEPEKCNDFATTSQRLCNGLDIDYQQLTEKDATTLQRLCNENENNSRSKILDEIEFNKLVKEAKQALLSVIPPKIKKPKKGKEKEVKETSFEALEIVNNFFEYSRKELNPAEKSQKTKVWGVLIDSIVFKGKYTHEDIENSIKWAKTHKFWKSKFLSLAKLTKLDSSDVEFIEVFFNGYEDDKEAAATPKSTPKQNGRKSGLVTILEAQNGIKSRLQLIELED